MTASLPCRAARSVQNLADGPQFNDDKDEDAVQTLLRLVSYCVVIRAIHPIRGDCGSLGVKAICWNEKGLV